MHEPRSAAGGTWRSRCAMCRGELRPSRFQAEAQGTAYTVPTQGSEANSQGHLANKNAERRSLQLRISPFREGSKSQQPPTPSVKFQQAASTDGSHGAGPAPDCWLCLCASAAAHAGTSSWRGGGHSKLRGRCASSRQCHTSQHRGPNGCLPRQLDNSSKCRVAHASNVRWSGAPST